MISMKVASRIAIVALCIPLLAAGCLDQRKAGQEDARPMTHAQALQFIDRPTSAYLGSPETRLRFLTMSDAKLANAAKMEPKEAIEEAAARARPSILNVYVAALDNCEFPEIAKAIRGITYLRDAHPSSPAGSELISLLSHRRLDVRASAASAIAAHEPNAASIPVLAEYIKAGSDGNLVLQCGRNLLKRDGQGQRLLVKEAKSRIVADPMQRYFGFHFDLLLTEFGDQEATDKVRQIASGKGGRHDRVLAIQVLCRSRGLQELATAEKCLVGPAELRTVAMHWVFHFGQKSSISKLRASASNPKQNLEGSKYFLDIPSTMIEFANRIEKGEKGPRPPDDYYTRGGTEWRGKSKTELRREAELESERMPITFTKASRGVLSGTAARATRKS